MTIDRFAPGKDLWLLAERHRTRPVPIDPARPDDMADLRQPPASQATRSRPQRPPAATSAREWRGTAGGIASATEVCARRHAGTLARRLGGTHSPTDRRRSAGAGRGRETRSPTLTNHGVRQSGDDTRTARATHDAWLSGPTDAPNPVNLRSELLARNASSGPVTRVMHPVQAHRLRGRLWRRWSRGGRPFVDLRDLQRDSTSWSSTRMTASTARCAFPSAQVDAIFAEDDVPPAQRAFTPLNAELATIWKPIIAMKPALPDAEEWAKVRDKMDQLKR